MSGEYNFLCYKYERTHSATSRQVYCTDFSIQTPPFEIKTFLFVPSFEVNLWLEDKVVLHFNTRWDQEKIVVSADDTDAEEHALFSTLVPDEDFQLKILFEDSGFQVFVIFCFWFDYSNCNNALFLF